MVFDTSRRAKIMEQLGAQVAELHQGRNLSAAQQSAEINAIHNGCVALAVKKVRVKSLTDLLASKNLTLLFKTYH